MNLNFQPLQLAIAQAHVDQCVVDRIAMTWIGKDLLPRLHHALLLGAHELEEKPGKACSKDQRIAGSYSVSKTLESFTTKEK